MQEDNVNTQTDFNADAATESNTDIVAENNTDIAVEGNTATESNADNTAEGNTENATFKIISKLGEKENAALQQYASFKLLIIIGCIFAVIIGTLAICSFVGGDIMSGIVYLLIGIALIVLFPIMMKKEQNKPKYKNKFVQEGILNLMEFNLDWITETTLRGDEKVGFTKLLYKDIYKVVDYKDAYYFIFISKIQAFIVDKSGFIVGDPEKFDEFFRIKNIPIKKFGKKQKTA